MLIDPISEKLFNLRNAFVICILAYMFLLFQAFGASPVPAGIDSATHLFQIDLISKEGLTSWNAWWYAGHPLLDQYPPLPHLLGAMLAKVPGFTVELAYKSVMAFGFLLLPVSFILFIEEFRLGGKQNALALYIFSFSSVFAYYLQGGVMSALFSIPFSLLFLKYMIRFFAFPKLRDLVLSSLFLALTSLSHLFTPVATVFFAFLYLLAFNPDLKSLKRLAMILALAGAMVVFFWAPLAFNYNITGSTGQFASGLASALKTVIGPFGRAFVTYLNYISIVIVLLMAALALISARLDYVSNGRSFLFFFILAVLGSMLWVLFLPHGDQAGGKLPLMLPAFFALFLCRQAFYNEKTKALAILLVILMFISAVTIVPSYFTPQSMEMARWSSAQIQARGLFLPNGYAFTVSKDKPNSDTYLFDSYLVPAHFGKEIYGGWFGEAAPRADSDAEISFSCTRTIPIQELVSRMTFNGKTIYHELGGSCTVPSSKERFCEIASQGAVDHIFANKEFPDAVGFLDTLPCAVRDEESPLMVSYRLINPLPYVDGGHPYSKHSGSISVFIDGTFKGDLTVRESFYPYWKASVDGSEVPVKEDKYGFLSIPLDLGPGSHELQLTYSSPRFFHVFDGVSLFAWLAVIIYIAKPSLFEPVADRLRHSF